MQPSPHAESGLTPLATRLESAVAALRRRWEQHLEQEVRLQEILSSYQTHWTRQSHRLNRQLAVLEAQLDTWLARWPTAPQLHVVTAEARD